MAGSYFSFLLVAIFVYSVNSSVISEQDGLYSTSDNVVILNNNNLKRQVYGRKTALVVQFYNAFCAHCRNFAPTYKQVALEIFPWNQVFHLGVVDCESNPEICADFEVTAFPSLRYFRENTPKGNANLGSMLPLPSNAFELKSILIQTLINEQSFGYFQYGPPLSLKSYDTLYSVHKDAPQNTKYIFLVFEEKGSTEGAALAMDINDYRLVRLFRVLDSSPLAVQLGHPRLGVLEKQNPNKFNDINPLNPTKGKMLDAINLYLKSNNFVFPNRSHHITPPDNNGTFIVPDGGRDVVHYSDLEKTIQSTLHHEVIRFKHLSGERLQALLDYLNVLITSFPFKKGNLKDFLSDLFNTLKQRTEWTGVDLSTTIKRLESLHAPVYMSNAPYIQCRGSAPQYRGYTCGLWVLFHTLTVNAALKSDTQGPAVLRAMYGYIKNFFGCTECSEHFQKMAIKNKLFDVKESDKAVLWLWISHNEVNLRLAGDGTEDPEVPKIQYPSVRNCPHCREPRGAWNLEEVLRYLRSVYSGGSIDVRGADSRASSGAPGLLSNLDIGMLSLLYIFSFIILVVVIKKIITKRSYRKRLYKHEMGKV